MNLAHALALKVSRTATGILSNQRLRAIGDSMQKPPTEEYSVAQSATFRKRLTEFDPVVRLGLLDRLQELATNRQPEGARREEASGHWVWAAGEPEVELVYEIAEEQKRILVRDARASLPAGGGDTDGSG